MKRKRNLEYPRKKRRCYLPRKILASNAIRRNIDNPYGIRNVFAEMKIETIAVHAGQRIDPATGAVSPPIHLSTTFERDVEGTYSRGFMYTRNDNPNRKALEEGVSALEGGAAAAAFASGTGATSAIFQALRPGDHILAHIDAYYGTTRLLREIFVRWGLEADFVDMSDLVAVK